MFSRVTLFPVAEAECRLGEVAVQASCRQKEAAMRVFPTFTESRMR